MAWMLVVVRNPRLSKADEIQIFVVFASEVAEQIMELTQQPSPMTRDRAEAM